MRRRQLPAGAARGVTDGTACAPRPGAGSPILTCCEPAAGKTQNRCMIFHMSRAARVRVLPFLVFMLLLALRGWLPADGAVGHRPALDLWPERAGGRRHAARLARGIRRAGAPDPARRARGCWAVAVGLAVFVLWIHLDAPWMTLGEATATFLPLDAEGRIDCALVAVRWIGAALMVPVMEELFWRSFLMRWIQRPGFDRRRPDPDRPAGRRAVAPSSSCWCTRCGWPRRWPGWPTRGCTSAAASCGAA